MNTNTAASQPRVLSIEEFAALIRKCESYFNGPVQRAILKYAMATFLA
ncbi:hypothetical protein [Pseudomonas syringae]|nr:hypothetical protein [Pseudomonas syringae]MCK9744983.1 hypothetical protein [Pseudomonas syringae pv. syringae]MCK9767274.1 hypothetical protein [Pseudomonas syringae pv. syringae]